MEEASASSTAPPAAPGPEVAPPGPPPAPSPLSGGYLLIILGEPHCEEHKDIILQRLAKGFLSWDSDVCHVDLEKELLHLAAQKPDGEESKNGERLIQFASESLVTEVLIQPQTTTLIQCARNLLSSFTRHRHIIHAGYTFAGNGSWALQDGTFSLLDFLDALREPEPQRVIRAYENNVSIDIQCSAEGEWSTAKITKEPGTKGCMVRVNPDDKMTAGSPGITQFVEYISNFLVPARIEELLEPSDVVGNIRFSHPTLYVFPGGQGDAALFGINGFNMLVDGGYSRKSCFWDFTRHLDRLDAVMVTRINNSNVGGIASVLKRKTLGYVYPQIGHFFCNMQERRSLPSPDGDKDRDPLLIDLLDEGHSLIANLRLLELKPHACYRDSVIEPINLYHKVGHGKLDMYVLSPAKDSKDVREFLAKWSTNDQKLFTSKTSKLDSQFPLYNMTSICALLVWQPANPTDTITRILFPGSTPQHKIFEGLEKIKHLEFLKFPTCTAKSMALSAAPKPKSKLFDKSAIETKVKKITPAIEKSIPIEPKSKLIEAEKNNKNNLSSQRVERKSTSKQEDKKDSPPTPKKAVEAKPKIEKVKRSRSPTIPPAKSDKEANNRKVLESKIEKSKTSTVKSAPKREPPKETKAVSEKKFVSLKKPKVAPPAKPSPPVSPKKQLKPKSSPKKVLKREVKSTTKKVEKVIKAKAPPALADDKPGESKVETEEPKPAHVEIEAVDDVLTATIVKEAEAAEEQSVEAADGEAPSALQSQAEDVTEEDILSDKQGDADEKVSETEGDIDTQVDEEMVTDDGENKHIRDEEESEKERAKKDNAEAEGVDAQIEEQEEEKQLEADIPEVTDAGVEVTTEIVLTETPEKEIEIKEGQVEQDQEVLDAKEKPVIVEKREDISEDKHPEIIKEKEAEEEVKDTADETVAPVQSDENQIEVKDVTPELCGVVDVIAATVADEQTVEEKEGEDISEETKQKIEGEVKEIISAQSKVAEEDATKETRETESVAVEVDAADTKIDVSSEKQKEDSPQEDKKDIKMEEGTNTKSQPDEKLSAMETSATTAPSMPEDEKIDDKIILDGIVEEKVEEKLVVAEVKEAAAPTIEPLKAIQLEQTHLQHHRDLVKTPDEVADLPMHEEVDGVLFDSSDDKKNDEDKIEQSPESLANKAAAKIDESVPQENVNTIEVAAEGTEVIESTPEQNEEQTKEIIGIKEMQKSAIDEKEVDTTLESKHDEKPTEAGSSLQKDMDEDVKEEVDAVPIGQYDEVEEAVGQEIKNVEDEKKDEEKKTPSPIQETKIDQKNDDAVDSATAQNGLELSDFEKVIDEEYGIKTQMKPAAEELSIKAEAVVEVQSLSISTKCPDKEALDTEEKDKESPKGDLELAEVETGSDGQLNDLSREKDEFVIDIDEKGSEAVGRRLSQTSPKQDLKLLEEETEEAIKDEPRSVVQKPDLSESDIKAPTVALDETTSLNQQEASKEESKQTARTPSPQVDTLPEAEPKTPTEKSNSPLPRTPSPAQSLLSKEQAVTMEKAFNAETEKLVESTFNGDKIETEPRAVQKNIQELSAEQTESEKATVALKSEPSGSPLKSATKELKEEPGFPVAVDLVQREDLATPVSTDTSKIATEGEDGFVKPADLADVKQFIIESTETIQLDSKDILGQSSTGPMKEELTMPKSPLEDVTGGSRPESAEPMKEDSPKQMEKSDRIISLQPEPIDKMLTKVDAILDDLQHLGSAGDDKQDSTSASHLELIEPAQADSREHSRPQSSAKLHMEDATSPKPSELANVELKDSSKPVSLEPSQNEIKALSPEPMKIDSETSRPVSAELKNDGLKEKSRPLSAELEKSENNDITPAKPESKESSRPESTEPAIVVAKECSGQDEVKIITKEHSHPESAELSITEPKGPSGPESAEPVVSDSRDQSRPASTDMKLVDTKDQSRPESSELKIAEEKDNSSSRPVSAEPAKSVANDQLQQDITESKDQTKTVPTEPLKKDSTESLQSELAAEDKDSMEPSRSASTELPIAESKEPSRPESVEVPKEPSRPESVEVPKELSRPESVEVPKEPSRPESVEVPREPSRPESVELPKDGSKEPSRPASTELLKGESKEPSRPQSAEPEKAESKVPSRPASTELPKAESKELSRPESAEIEKAGSKESSRPASTEVPRAESKEPSRPQSAELEKADSKEPSRPASEELAKAESKEPSRPESADEAKDGSKEPSRPAPTELPKAESKEPSRPESADIAKDGSKEPSRPASADLSKAESKEPSRPESADVAKDGSKEPSRPASTDLPKAESKEPSRPESAEVVAKDGLKEHSRPASTELPRAASNDSSRPQSTEPKKAESKEPSRPASTELPKAESKEPPQPESTEMAKDGKKEPSRPASTEVPKGEVKELSRPQSVEQEKAGSKESSRPESAEVVIDDKKEPSRPASTEVPKDEVKELSRPQSVEKEQEELKEPSRPASTELTKVDSKESSRSESAEVAKDVSKESSRPASTDIPKADSKEPSRPDSSEEAKDGSTELSRPTSSELPKADSKEPSRPESAEEAKDGSTELSRPTSTELPKTGSIDPLPLQSAEPEKAGSKESSRPASTEAPKSESKDLSRPESVESVKLESNEPSRPVSTQEEKIDTKQPSRSESTQPSNAESLKQGSTEAYSLTDAKESSRPESTELKSDSKDTSRPKSAELKNIECKEELHSVSQSKIESSKSFAVETEIVELKTDAVYAETLGRPESAELGKIAAEVLSRPESTTQGSKEASRPTSTELKITKQSEKSQSKDEDVEQSESSKTSRPVSTGEEEKSQELASSKSVEQVSADKNILQEVVEDFAHSKLETIHSALDSTSSKETTQEQSLPLTTNSDEQSCKESKETIDIRETPTIISGETYQEYSEANILTSSEKTDDLTSKKMDALFADDKEITKSPSPEPELRDIEFFKEEKSPSPAPSINEANALLNGKPLSGAPSPLPPLDISEKIPVVEGASLEPISPAKIESENKVSVREETLSAESITKEVERTEVDAHSEKSELLKDLKLGSTTVTSTLAETDGGNNSSLLTNTEIQSAQHVPTEPSASLSPILIADDFTQSKEATSLEKSPSTSRTVVEESKLPINGQVEKSEPMQFIRKMSDGVSASPPPKDLDISGSPPLPMEHSSNDKHTSKSPSPAPSLVDEKKSPSPEPAVKDKDSKTPSPQPTKITESEPSKQTAASQSAEKTPSPSEVSDPITASYIEIINKLQSDSTESGGGKPVLAQIDDPMTRSTLFEQDIDSSDVPEYEKTQVGAEIDPLQPGDEHTIKKSHHRLMLTASSEDGGGETEFDTAPLTSQEKGIKIEPEKHTDVGVSSAVRVSTPPSSSAEKKTSSTGVNVDKFSIPEDVKTIERAVDKQIELDHSSIFVAANVPLKDDIEISSTKMYDSSKVSNTERVPSPGYESDHDNVPPSPHSDISSGQMSRDPHVWDDNRSSSRQSEISDKDISSPPFTTSKMKFDVTPQSVMTGSFYGGLPGDEEFAPIESIAKDVKDSKNQIAKLGEIAIATESAVSELLPMAGPSLSSQEKAEPKSTSTAPKDPIESWGKPLGLPSPAPPATNDTIGSQHGTPKKEKTAAAKKAVDRSKAKSNKDASTKNKIPASPMYFDLTYVPHHGNSNYSQVEFFKNVRARYYVFSGIEPSKEVYDALLEGKQSWDEKDLEVTIIPTYDTDTLGQWVAENEESIALNKIDLSPSASRCTINLQDHETSCSAYRLEF